MNIKNGNGFMACKLLVVFVMVFATMSGCSKVNKQKAGLQAVSRDSIFFESYGCEYSSSISAVVYDFGSANVNDLSRSLIIEVAGFNNHLPFSVFVCDKNFELAVDINQSQLKSTGSRVVISMPEVNKTLKRVDIVWKNQRSSLVNVPVGKIIKLKHPDNNPANNLDLSEAIDKVLKYSRSLALEPIEMLMLDRLINTYHLTNLLDAKSTYLSLIKNVQDEGIKTRLLVPARMLDKNIIATREQLNAITLPDSIIFSALYCDVYPLSEDTAHMWQQELEKGGYAATHILLAYQWTLDHGCSVPSLPENFADMATSIAIDQVKPEDGLDDMEVEALCWVAMLGFEEKIKPEWITLLLKSQREDGGWIAWPSKAESSAHTSGLAAWLLLDLYFYNQSFGGHVDS